MNTRQLYEAHYQNLCRWMSRCECLLGRSTMGSDRVFHGSISNTR